LEKLGINTVAIMSNDPTEYVEDSFENMQKIAREFDFSFPYLLDESQQVAKAYGAVCTPDFFGYNADLKLQYRGRFERKPPLKMYAGIYWNLCRKWPKQVKGLQSRYPAWAAQ
jgi:hypothetical protein